MDPRVLAMVGDRRGDGVGPAAASGLRQRAQRSAAEYAERAVADASRARCAWPGGSLRWNRDERPWRRSSWMGVPRAVVATGAEVTPRSFAAARAARGVDHQRRDQPPYLA